MHRGARWIRGLVGLLALCVGLGSIAGCYYTVTTDKLPSADRSAAAPTGPVPYTIQIGDHLGVKFYQSPDLNEEVVVRPDGKISLQLIGEVQAAGVEPGTLQAQIEHAYQGELATPRVVVLVRELGAQVYVGGEVKTPGAIPLTANLTLVEAVQRAGGFLDSAHLSQVVLIRRDAAGQLVGRAVDVRPIIGGLEPSKDVPLQPFDLAYVPRSKIADVNLWVKQYISNNLPTIPIALPVF